MQLAFVLIACSSYGIHGTSLPYRHVCYEAGCWPLTWMLGCQKCGTSSLGEVLDHSRLACYASVTGINVGKPIWYGKETHYWDNVTQGVALDPTYYLQLYPKTRTHQCRSFLEATPNYLPMVKVAATISRLMPRQALAMVRFIIVLREPIARDLSSYNHQRHTHEDWVAACPANSFANFEAYADCGLGIYRRIFENANMSLDEKLSAVSRDLFYSVWSNLYFPQLQGWLSYFPRDQFLVMQFDHVTKDPFPDIRYLIRIFLENKSLGNFVSLEAKMYESNATLHPTNVMNSPDKRTVIDCTAVDKLNSQIYHAWNSDLYTMLEDDRRLGRAPTYEPPFPHFPSTFPCRRK